jgi:two-component system, NarL family, response regulator
MTMPIRVMVVDDHAIVREGIAAVIAGEPDLALAGAVGGGRLALERYDVEKPDVVLLDLRMKDMDGLATLSTLLAHHPRARVLMLSSHAGDEAIHRSLAMGAVGYILKTSPVEELLVAIRAARAGRVVPGAEVANQLAKRVFSEPLSDREVEVLREIASGASNKEVGTILGIAEGTVKNHVNNILTKLDAVDRTQAVTIAARRGIIDLGA